MKSTWIRALCALLCIAPLIESQTYTPKYFVRLAAVTGATTIVNPLTSESRKKIAMRGVYVRCAGACAFDIERDGATPAGTPLTIQKGTKAIGASVATAFSAASTAVGVVINNYSLAGAGYVPVPIMDVDLPPDGTSSNFTLRMTSGTADTVYIEWLEI